MLHKVVLTLSSWMKPKSETIRKKDTEQYFHIVLYKVSLTFKNWDKNHSNKSYLVILSSVLFLGGSSLIRLGKTLMCDHVKAIQ